MLVAGIDQGTTSTKALLLGDDGTLRVFPGLRHIQSYPAPGRVEQDPRELLENVVAAAETAVGAGARTLGLANQGETVIAWNRVTGQPLAPAIVWQDQRTSDAIAQLAAQGLGEEISQRSGLPLDAYFSASKLRWLLDNVPDARELATRGSLGLGTSDSYFIERLTGRYATDPTTASRTSLMSLANCAWDDRLCEIFGVPIETLPEIVDDSDPVGEIRLDAGTATLGAAVVDQVAALYGHGCRQTADGKITIGTGAFALLIAAEGRPEAPSKGSVMSAAWQTPRGRAYAADGGVYSAASALEWLKRVGVMRDNSDLEALDGQSAVSMGTIFVPALSGLGFPHWDRRAAGMFIGIDAGTERETLIKAVLEGIAFRVSEVLDALGFAPDTAVPIDGGLSRCVYFCDFLSNVSVRPLISRGDVEITALGVAQLAACCVAGQTPGATPGLVEMEAVRIEPRLSQTQARDWRARFTDALGRSRAWRS